MRDDSDPLEGTSKATAFLAPLRGKTKQQTQKDRDGQSQDDAEQSTSEDTATEGEEISFRDIAQALKPQKHGDAGQRPVKREGSNELREILQKIVITWGRWL